MCQYTSDSAQRLEEHMNRAHFDLTSPSLANNDNSTNVTNPTLALTTQSSLHCPLCEKAFTNGAELEVHVNIEHRDILSPQKVVNIIYLH